MKKLLFKTLFSTIELGNMFDENNNNQNGFSS